MHKLLTFAVGLATLAIASVASAQFDGPAPLAWRWQQSSSVAPGGSPLVVGDTIYQSLGGRIFSLDKDSANLKWRFPALDPIDGIFRNSPINAGGVIVAAGDNKMVYGIDPESGQLKWSAPTPAGVFGEPVLVGKLVICALSDNTLIAINPADGTMAWTKAYSVYDGIQGSLGSLGNNVIFCTTNTKVCAFNVDSQKYTWSKPFDQLPPRAVPVVQGSRIYINSGSFLVALNGDTGNPIWQVDTRMQLAFAPAVSQVGVMVVSEDGHAMMYSPDRKPLTKAPIELNSLPIARPTAVGTKFVVPTSNGGILLFDPASGKMLWDYIIHPIDELTYSSSNNKAGAGGKGGGLNGPGGLGGPGGGGGAGVPGGRGGFGQGGAQNTNNEKPYYIQANGQAVLAGQTLLVPAKDGSLLAFDKDLGVDLTAPVARMLFPNPGEAVSGQPPLLLLIEIIDDNSGLNKDSVKISVDGHDLDYRITKEGLFMVQFSMTGKNRPLGDGRRTIVVTSSDWLGNETKTEFALQIDNTLKPIKLPGQDSNPNGGLGGPGGGGKGGGFGGLGGVGGDGGG